MDPALLEKESDYVKKQYAYYRGNATQTEINDRTSELAEHSAEDKIKCRKATELDHLACSIADDYTTNDGAGGMAGLCRSIAYTKEAVDIGKSLKVFPSLGSFYNSLMAIYWDVYDSGEGNSDDIKQSEHYGRLAVKAKSSTQPKDVQDILAARRANLLARTLYAKYCDKDIGGAWQDLDAALVYAGKALDGRASSNDDALERFETFVKLLIVKAEVKKELNVLRDAIAMRLDSCYDSNDICAGAPDEAHARRAATRNLVGLLWLFGKLYEWTKEPRDLNELLGMLSDREASTTQDRLIATSDLTRQLFVDEDYSRGRLEDLSTSIFLAKLALDATPPTVWINMKRRLDLLIDIEAMLDAKWKRTGDDAYGYEANKCSFENCRLCISIQMLEDAELQSATEEEVKKRMKGSMMVTISHCRVTGDRITTCTNEDGQDEITRVSREVWEREDEEQAAAKEAEGNRITEDGEEKETKEEAAET